MFINYISFFSSCSLGRVGETVCVHRIGDFRDWQYAPRDKGHQGDGVWPPIRHVADKRSLRPVHSAEQLVVRVCFQLRCCYVSSKNKTIFNHFCLEHFSA